jgi:hypothetical protein
LFLQGPKDFWITLGCFCIFQFQCICIYLHLPVFCCGMLCILSCLFCSLFLIFFKQK